MKYFGMPMGMWMLFGSSFRRQLTVVFGYNVSTSKKPRQKLKLDTKKSSLNYQNLKSKIDSK